MSEPRICPNCRTQIPSDSPPGICPYCALRAGFYGEDATPGLVGRVRVMPPEELARHLPDLEDFELIGTGGMGTVYKARQRQLGRSVAVKVLHAHLAAEPSFADRFNREARTLARLDHPNIVRVYDCGQRDGLYYLVMELVEGVNLRQAIEAKSFEPKEALAMVPLVCAALQYAHDNGVVHRDIKPENILLDRSGSLKVADFGLAKLAGASEPRLTATQQVLGTPHYMAPEQIEKPEQVDHRADIFALGVVFYEMLTGELPVGRFPPPSDRVEVDVRVDRVVLRTLEKEPSLRYQRASDLQTDVELLSASEPPPREAAPSEGGTSARRPFEYRSKRTLLGLPLIHINLSRDPTGRRLKVARGIFALGDVAIGGVAVGGLAIGGVAVGGLSCGVVATSGVCLGLIAVGGVAFGLLFALGGVAIGSFAVGSIAIGLAPIGPSATKIVEVSEAALRRLGFVAWGAAGAAPIAVAGAVWAWLRDRKDRFEVRGSRHKSQD